MRHANPVLLQAKLAAEGSRAELEHQRERLRHIRHATSAVQRQLARTRELLQQIDAALLAFKALR
jgi:septal ring factor EnvC (AmiA/AmiB activator)